jgi:multiple sugar transport system substrate-binding protein
MERRFRGGMDRRTLVKGAAAFGLSGMAGRRAAGRARAQEGVALEFWDMVWGPPEYIDTGERLVAQFNEEHPGITVEYRSTPWNNWYQTFTTAIGAGTAPDVSTGAAYQSVQFYDQGAVSAVDDVIAEWEADGTLADMTDWAHQKWDWNGMRPGVTWQFDSRFIFYRKDLF